MHKKNHDDHFLRIRAIREDRRTAVRKNRQLYSGSRFYLLSHAAQQPPQKKQRTPSIARQIPLLCSYPPSGTRFAERRLLDGARRLRGRLRTIPDDTTARAGGKLALPETNTIGQVKKSQQNRAPACGSRRIPAPNLMGTGILPEKLMACPEFRREDDINLNILIEIAQGHFVSPARGTDLGAQKEPR